MNEVVNKISKMQSVKIFNDFAMESEPLSLNLIRYLYLLYSKQTGEIVKMIKGYFFLNFLVFFSLFILGGCQTTDSARVSVDEKMSIQQVQSSKELNGNGRVKTNLQNIVKVERTILYQDFITQDYVQKHQRINRSFSRDGSWMLTQSCKPFSKEFSRALTSKFHLWKYSSSLQSYKLYAEMAQDSFATLSNDGKYVAAIRRLEPWHPSKAVDQSELKTEVFNIDNQEIIATFSPALSNVSFNSENTAIAGFSLQQDQASFDIYSLKTAQEIGPDKKIPVSSWKNNAKPVFDPKGRYLAVSFNEPASSLASSTFFLDAEQFTVIRKWEDAEIKSVSINGDLIILEHGGRNKIFDIHSQKEIFLPGKVAEGPVVLGPKNKLLRVWSNSFNEYYIDDERVTLLKTKWFPSKAWVPNTYSSGEVVYISDVNKWYGFRDDEVIVMESSSEEAIQAALKLDEGTELLEAGFYRPGLFRIKEAITTFPQLESFLRTTTYVDLAAKGLSVHLVAELLLMHKEKMEEIGDSRQSVRRLIEYGMFAGYSGHPDLVKEAADEIRKFHSKLTDNGAAHWLAAATALEGMFIAETDQPDKAYDYIFENGGLIRHDQKKYISWYITRFPEYWTPLYADRKKLAYLLEVEEADLPDPELKAVVPQPYPDLNGRLREPATASNMLEESTR